jgi:hypothetical protein
LKGGEFSFNSVNVFSFLQDHKQEIVKVNRLISVLVLLLVAALVTFAAGPAQAFTAGLTYTEDATTGLVIAIPTASPTIYVASDGEEHFDPFGYGADTSDGIQFTAGPGVWAANTADFAAGFSAGYWTLLSDGITWVLPASTPSGNENEPRSEPAAGWYFVSGAQWLDITPASLTFFEPNGEWSDTITMNNNGPGGSAQIIFQSDPVVPLPPTALLLGSGLLGLWGFRKSRKG